MATYSDEYIEHYGELFTQHDLFGRYRVRFDAFLIAPEAILEACLQREFSPLLPEQWRVRDRLEQEAECTTDRGRPVELHGDHLVQPMSHRNEPKAWKTHTRRAQA